MKFEKLKPGTTVYSVGRYKMGNTTMSTVGVWHVRIISVDAERRTAVVRWNGNPATTYSERQIGKLREKEPLLIDCGLGARFATREEIKRARSLEPQQ